MKQQHTLRDYQEGAVEEIRRAFSSGKKKVLLHLATGAGKTTIFSHVLKATQSKGWPAMMVVRGRKLVDQGSQRLIREGVEHGVLMARHWMYRPHLSLQVASVDTMIARGLRPPARLLVIDECHMATSPGYKEILEDYPDAFVLAVTATPYTKDSLEHLADVVVQPIKLRELIARGYLVPPRYFCPTRPDLSRVRVSSSTGDYESSGLELVMDRASLTGDIVEQWKKHAGERPTICFAVSIKHSLHLRDAFESHGIRCEHLEANTPEEEREAAIARLERGETKVLTNVGILCTGVDIPKVSCIVLARPTKSYSLYVQQVGRGTRTSPGKADFLVLDHADNVSRHGFVEDEPEACIDGGFTKAEPQIRICKRCFLAYEGARCPSCPAPERQTPAEDGPEIPEAVPGELVEAKAVEETQSRLLDEQAKLYRDECRREASLRGYRDGWVWHQVAKRYGKQRASRVCNDRLRPWEKISR